jgi:hypothetical protein
MVLYICKKCPCSLEVFIKVFMMKSHDICYFNYSKIRIDEVGLVE